jgi:intracellular septation protein
MKFLVDFFPILLFFVAYKVGDIYYATATAIIASLIQVSWSRYQKGHFEKLPLFTLIALVLLGGSTLIFRNELFIKWKPTAVYWLLSAGFLLSQFIGEKKPIIQRLAEQNIHLHQSIWNKLNISWVIFFCLLGFLNLYVIYHYDTDTWVNFKLFGTMGLTLLFVIVQGFYMARHHQSESEPHGN